MLTIHGAARRLCDGSARRDFLRVGALGGLDLSLPGLLRAASAPATAEPGFGRARRCILLVPFGGPSQLETFDPKPDAPSGVRGDYRPIATRVTGIRIGEGFPRLAEHADKLCILRSVTHKDTVHTSACYTMLTGAYHPVSNPSGSADLARPTANDHPHLGSIVAK